MKKVGLKSLVSLLVLGLFLVMAWGSSESSGVDTGSGKLNQDSKQTEEEETKIVAVNKIFTVNDLEITLGEVKIESKKIFVGMTLRNNSKAKLTFYPDQGCAVVGNIQLDANMFMTEGKLSGDILAGVQKSGVIVFTTDTVLNPQEVKQIIFDFGSVYHESWEVATKEAKISIDLP